MHRVSCAGPPPMLPELHSAKCLTRIVPLAGMVSLTVNFGFAVPVYSGSLLELSRLAENWLMLNVV